MPFFERSQFEAWSRIDNSLRRFEVAYFEQAKRAYPDELNAIDFAEGRPIDWEEALQRDPGFVNYLFGYFDLGEDYYRQIRDQVVKSANNYIQEDYLEILRKICK